ncbi:unnamed protein product [Periconia digitata]|uniref:Heterokaryon incompatibility domain-containing protein n=1 Tax=Periconia digitata TaxID=1303443 RepID=A0A9W4U8Y4_9PLEO|nr:unnamed protein product [Periconia digitata]
MSSYSRSKADAVALQWLKECESKHIACRKPRFTSPPTLPRRLLFIGALNSKEPRLIETSSLGDPYCRYATLSHCWGIASLPLQTTTSNLASRSIAICWDDLSSTYKDAIVVSQRMGVQYLWIDSLCIIQDDQKDFEEECSRMHFIYSNCYFMIAASDTKDGSEGFLPPPNAEDESTALSETSAFNPSSSTFRRNGSLDWMNWSAMLEGTLYKRCWAYQERQLAPRIIHYTHHGILWECRIGIGAGDISKIQLKRSTLFPNHENYMPKVGIFRILDLERTRLARKDIMTFWRFSVEEYSEKSLTHTVDRLPSLSGLAVAIASLLSNEPLNPSDPLYLAGLWLPDLNRQLFWTPTFPHDATQEQAQVTSLHPFIPTWSPLSYPNPISFHQALWNLETRTSTFYDIHKEKLENSITPNSSFAFLSTDIRPTSANGFGKISGTALRIRGCYIDLKVTDNLQTITQKIENQELRPDTRKLVTFHETMHYVRIGGHAVCMWFDFAAPDLPKDTPLRFLILFESEDWNVGLILRAKSGGGAGQVTYEKIGLFGIDPEKDRPIPTPLIRIIRGSRPQDMPEVEAREIEDRPKGLPQVMGKICLVGDVTLV